MPDEETDVSFANFGLDDGSKRLYPAPAEGVIKMWSARPVSNRRPSAWEDDPDASNNA